MKRNLSVAVLTKLFFLADLMKAGPFDDNGFREALAHCRVELAGLSSEALIGKHGDANRKRFYEQAKWRRETIDVRNCVVYPGFGERPKSWTSGYVREVAARIEAQADVKLQAMAAIPNLLRQLPLIAHVKRGLLTFDHGNHRAVALAMAGIFEAEALIATHS